MSINFVRFVPFLRGRTPGSPAAPAAVVACPARAVAPGLYPRLNTPGYGRDGGKLFMAVVARLYPELRGSARHQVALDATLRDPARQPFDVIVEELSATGARLPAAVDLVPGSLITLGISGIGMCDARVVRRDGRGYGCEFLFPLSAAELNDAMAAVPTAPIMLASFLPTPMPAAPVGEEAVPVRPLRARVRLAIILALTAASWTGLYWASALTA